MMQVGASSVDGQTRDLLGLIVSQRNDEEGWGRSEPYTWIREALGRKRA